MDSSEVMFYSVNFSNARSGYRNIYHQFNMTRDIVVIFARLIRKGRRIGHSGLESYLVVL